GNADRQLESPRTCTTWVQEQNSLPPMDGRPMRVAADHHVKIHCRRLQFHLLHIVQHVNRKTSGMNELKFRNPVRPITFVVIAANSYDRSKGSQAFQDFRPADIAGMKDQTNALEGLQDFRTEKSMSIGDDADDFFVRHEI